jgi:hypothetical protein
MTLMRNTVDLTGGKPITVSGVSTVKALIAFYDIHGRKGEVLSFSYVPDITWIFIKVID